MAQKTITCRCGHKEVVTISSIYNSRQRDERIEYLERTMLCRECQEEETEKRSIEKGYIPVEMSYSMYKQRFSKFFGCRYNEENKSIRVYLDPESHNKLFPSDLPELEGTEREVLWAAEIRKLLIEKVNKIKEFVEVNPDKVPAQDAEMIENLTICLPYMLKNKTDAQWYIQAKASDKTPFQVILSVLGELDSAPQTEETTAATEMPELKILEPEEESPHQGFVEVCCDEDKVSAEYEKNTEFLNVVKSLEGYKWSYPRWTKKITYRTGRAEDRAAELVNELLRNGFRVQVKAGDLTDIIVRKAADATFEPEHDRWISLMTDTGLIAISWAGRDNNLYNKARSLPKSKWEKGSVMVSPRYYEEIRDFTALYDFRLSPGAERALAEAEEKTLKERLNPKKASKPEKKDGLEEILESDGIIEDLLDN